MKNIDHFGQLKWPGSERWRTRSWVKNLNKVLQKLGVPLALKRSFDHREDMLSLEQAANIQLLLSGVLSSGVQGAAVELGCYTGSTSAVMASLLKARGTAMSLHVYDSFAHELGGEQGVRTVFEENFRKLDLPLPAIHAGDLRITVPAQLPASIAFAHLDLGVGGDPGAHASILTYALEAVYPRLAPHAVLVIQDYHVPGLTVDGNDSNPGVRLACDAFFNNKPEHVSTLYGGPCSHGYIRKS